MFRCPLCGRPSSEANRDCPRDDWHPESEPETKVEISKCSDCGKEHEHPTDTCQEVGFDAGVADGGGYYEERQFLCPCGGIVCITSTTTP